MPKSTDAKRVSRLIILYSFFALIAIAVNFAIQIVSLELYPGLYSLYISILAGTGAGFLVRYFLDKKYIFKYRIKRIKHELRTMVLYACMSVITTGIFWCFELSFHFLFTFPQAKFVGGTIGLIIAFTAKYFLDKKFVFTK